MDEFEFQRILNLFPVVRPRDYHVDSASSSQSTAQSAHNDMGTWGGADVKEIPIQGTGPHDAFWRKLRMAAEKKVYEELSLAAASSILSSSQSSEEE
ncbi:uncharacterized protein LOC114322388 isoform X2 [Camellia sinensis]|uniref:uncharacterized protein LOC114322388 isoform X2 n=1 Tax=Camellia sinensis TaxID=4442 RepID=UPI0010355D06|nr:uncharacterized protein LOC114322388 isoform X2 [Camellia sinensis]